MTYNVIIRIVCYILLFFLSGCTKIYMEREDLFSISLGKEPDQINLFAPENVTGNGKNRIFFKHGIILLSNDKNKKIMQMSSYGNLLTLFYNKQYNPKFLRLPSITSDKLINNLKSFAFPFQKVGELVSSQKDTLLVEDELDTNNKQNYYNQKLGVQLRQVIQRFNAYGKYLGYIGQRGFQTEPFPYIESLHITENNDLVVIARTLDDWLIYWFANEGEKLLYQRKFNISQLPVIVSGNEENATNVIDTIYPDLQKQKIYIHIYNYHRSQNNTGPTTIDTQGYIYIYDMQDLNYNGAFRLPRNEYNMYLKQEQKNYTLNALFKFIGVSTGSNLFFLGETNSSDKYNHEYQLLIISSNGTVKNRRSLYFKNVNNIGNYFTVSQDGVLVSLLEYETHALISMWRSDKFIQ